VLRHSSGIEILPYLLNLQCGSFPMDVMATGTQTNGRANAQSAFNDRHGHLGEQFPGALGTIHWEANLWFIHSRQLPFLLRDTNDYTFCLPRFVQKRACKAEDDRAVKYRDCRRDQAALLQGTIEGAASKLFVGQD